jgi:Lar family restriction alleviation protein
MSDVPARCPFCGSDQIDFFKADVGVDWGFMGCAKCQTEGPIGNDDIRALARWNRRDPAALRTVATEARNAALREAIAAVEDVEDPAFNRAIYHSIEAIRALLKDDPTFGMRPR